LKAGLLLCAFDQYVLLDHQGKIDGYDLHLSQLSAILLPLSLMLWVNLGLECPRKWVRLKMMGFQQGQVLAVPVSTARCFPCWY
jgi:hypothetical protein